MVQPNPSRNYFSVTFRSDYSNKTGNNIDVKIFNGNGMLIDTYHNVNVSAVLRVGDKFLPGTYYLEASQSGIRETIKLLKQ